MKKIDFQKELEREIERNVRDGLRPRLLLHSCCGPCSAYVLSYLSPYFQITLFYDNPNIFPKEEYLRRLWAQRELLERIELEYPVSFLAGEYEPWRFLKAAEGLEGEPEGGNRCAACFRLRLFETAKRAKKMGADYFATTLTVSPHKNAALINEISHIAGLEYGVSPLLGDFKKKGGYMRSVQLAKEYGLYRQNYCGCLFCAGGQSREF